MQYSGDVKRGSLRGLSVKHTREAKSNDLALRIATGEAPEDEEPMHEKHHDSAPMGLAIHEMLDRN